MNANNQKLLTHVIESAFDFLETAIDEFNEKPKYSILHFSTAVELFLKARLIHEHWSLIVADNEVDKIKFENGNFRSITMIESIKKIRNIIGYDFQDNYQKAFLNIANHRNKVVHFFHAEVTNNAFFITSAVASEQCIGWYYLRGLINHWHETFSKYHDKVNDLNTKMKKHYTYLSAVFDQVKHNINDEKKEGAIYKKCPSCQFESSRQSKITDNVVEYKCLVCSFEEEAIVIGCPECEAFIEITEVDNEPFECQNCNQQVYNDYVSEVLSTEIVTHDNYQELKAINCLHCCSYDSVITHHHLFICAHCHAISKDAAYCEWCNERQIGGGDLKDSFLSGCDFCDGRLGHKDD